MKPSSHTPADPGRAADMIEAARARRPDPLTGVDRVVTAALAATLVAVAAAMALAAPGSARFSAVDLAVLVCAYAAATLVEIEVSSGAAVPTQLVLVPMLFVLPPGWVPLAVAAGLVLGGVVNCVRGRIHPNRVLVSVPNAWHAVGPAAVLVLAGSPAPQWGRWAVYAGALAAQFALDLASTAVREVLVTGVRPRALVAAFLVVWRVDVLLTPLGLLAAHGRAYLALVPALLLLADLARDRRVHVGRALSAARDLQEQRHRRELTAALLDAEETERARIATSLHDDTIQVMVASLYGIDRVGLLTRRAGAGEAVADALAELRSTLSEATERARRLTFELRPTVLYERGIAAAVEVLADRVEEETGATVDLDLTTERFDGTTEEVAYRTLQEALANARRHSGARWIAVSLVPGDGILRGSVSDDGDGFDMREVQGRGQIAFHLGMDAMAERIRMTGGELGITSAPWRGTTVAFAIPLPDRAGREKAA